MFNKPTFRCIACPPTASESSKYPNCDCGKNGKYNLYFNECEQCPFGSEGIYPNCTCLNDNATYLASTNWCSTCPYGSTGIRFFFILIVFCFNKLLKK